MTSNLSQKPVGAFWPKICSNFRESDGREEDFGAAVMAGRHAPPVLEPSKHDLDAVSPLVAALVALSGC